MHSMYVIEIIGRLFVQFALLNVSKREKKACSCVLSFRNRTYGLLQFISILSSSIAKSFIHLCAHAQYKLIEITRIYLPAEESAPYHHQASVSLEIKAQMTNSFIEHLVSIDLKSKLLRSFNINGRQGTMQSGAFVICHKYEKMCIFEFVV